MELLNALTDRTLIVALAIVGAVMATAGGILGGRRMGNAKAARLLTWAGYLVSFASVALFIVAGFLKGR